MDLKLQIKAIMFFVIRIEIYVQTTHQQLCVVFFGIVTHAKRWRRSNYRLDSDVGISNCSHCDHLLLIK